MMSKIFIMTVLSFLILYSLSLPLKAQKNDKNHLAFSGMPKEQAIKVQKNAAKYYCLPLNFQIKINENITIDFVLIPPGDFKMGSKYTKEEVAELFGGKASEYDLEYSKNSDNQHTVKLTKPFYMSTYEITQSQWNAFMENNPSPIHNPILPVGHVSWDDCKFFCSNLSTKTGKDFRLPTEAEWEYACRAGTTTEFYFGDKLTKELANYDSDSAVPVGSYPSNAWGLFDMHGNVLEWVEDAYYWYTEDSQIDPLETEHQFGRMYRGGFYSGKMNTLRSARRVSHYKSMSYEFYGFRIVCPVE